MAKDINADIFDEATILKLEIFGKCFQEWLPVFLHDPFVEEVYIFDFFAGSGHDIVGNYGSPLIIFSEAKGENKKYCKNVVKPIHFFFNEKMQHKCNKLNQNVFSFVRDCETENQCSKCIYFYNVFCDEFGNIFENLKIQSILENNRIGKFILLDQYGFKEINDDVFKKLIEYPRTDFIFFISSSFIKRFKDHPNTKFYIDTSKIDFDESRPNECHRIIASYFRNLIPSHKEYYLHHFSIHKSKSNYYGLIFGSNHSLGMEKFLKVCWSLDQFSGEANYNIENDYEEGSLFFNPNNSNKRTQFRDELRSEILKGNIIDNKHGFKYTLQHGCEPKLFTEVTKDLERENKICRHGELNWRSTNIHKVPIYNIEVL